MGYVPKPERWKRVRRYEEAGKCGWCGAKLEGRRTSWCSDACRIDSDRASGGYVRHDALRANRKKHGGQLRCDACNRRLYSPHSNEWAEGRANGDVTAWDDRRLVPEVDHVVPLALGSSLWELSNLQVLCGRPCHWAKTCGDQRRIAEARRMQREKLVPLDMYAETPLEAARR